MNDRTKVFWEGWTAGMADDPFALPNPYDKGSKEYEEWCEGHSDGLYNWDMNMDDGG